MIYSFFNVLIYAFPANWIWGQKGWLKQLGAVDLAGAGTVHMLGGVSGTVYVIGEQALWSYYRGGL